MKKQILSRAALLAAIFCMALQAAEVQAQSGLSSNLLQDVIIGTDKIGGDDLKNPPPPPALSLDESSLLKISFYPNPCRDMLHLQWGQSLNQLHVTIYNLVGNKVMEEDLAQDNSSLNVSQLRSGIYLIEAGGKAYRFTKI